MTIPSDGFIYVASVTRLYYEFSLYSAQSLKDCYPNAHITLFTHKTFLDERSKIFDNIITDIPVHIRAKMWCMARTPYENTIYIDCDSIINSPRIKNMFDFLKSHDMFFGPVLTYTVANPNVAYIDIDKNIPVEYHGSMCGYRKTGLTLDFHQTWFDEYLKQQNEEWKHTDYHEDWKTFDMFTLWKISSGKFTEFDRFKKLSILKLSRGWNTTTLDVGDDAKKRVITQIPKSNYRKMENVWPIIEKNLNDDSHKLKQPSARKTIAYYD